LRRIARMILERFGWLFAGGLCVAFGLQVLLGDRDKALTWEEPGDIASGYVN